MSQMRFCCYFEVYIINSCDMYDIISIPFLIPMILSDMKSRTVSSWLLLLFGLSVTLSECIERGLSDVFYDSIFNILIFIVIGIMICLYALFRNTKIALMIGLGDVLFFICVMPAFHPYDYVIFMIASCCTALTGWLISYLFHSNADVPLITYSGICFILYSLYRLLA